MDSKWSWLMRRIMANSSVICLLASSTLLSLKKQQVARLFLQRCSSRRPLLTSLNRWRCRDDQSWTGRTPHVSHRHQFYPIKGTWHLDLARDQCLWLLIAHQQLTLTTLFNREGLHLIFNCHHESIENQSISTVKLLQEWWTRNTKVNASNLIQSKMKMV